MRLLLFLSINETILPRGLKLSDKMRKHVGQGSPPWQSPNVSIFKDQDHPLESHKPLSSAVILILLTLHGHCLMAPLSPGGKDKHP